MLNEFYSAGCAGVTKAPADLCEKCTDPHALGYGLDKTYFPFAVEKFYESDYAYFNTINSNTILRTELFCASMMMVPTPLAVKQRPESSGASMEPRDFQRMHMIAPK